MGYVRNTDHAVLVVSADEFAEAIGVMTRRALASKLGLASAGFLNHLTSGRRTGCTPELASKIEEAVGAEPGSLFTVHATTDRTRYRYPRDTRREVA